MLRIEISKLKPASTELNGATVGEAHSEEMRAIIIRNLSENQVVLGFERVTGATASYLKRIINPFFASLSDPESLRREVFPVITNIGTQDLREDIDAYLASSERVLILGKESNGRVQYEDLLGRLDGAAAETFSELRSLKRVSALQLYERYKNRTTNQTAWNNRLAKLVEMRVARRYREGRIWIYQPSIT